MFLATWRNGRVCPPEDKNAAGQPNTLMGKSANGARGQKFHRKKLFDCRPNGERNLQSMTSTGENSHYMSPHEDILEKSKVGAKMPAFGTEIIEIVHCVINVFP